MDYPARIVCLTDETTETLYLLGEQARIVGISGYTVRPPQARREKPKVSAFTSAKIDKILALQPDLVLGFSNLQADIAADLIRAGVAVHIFNQRSVAGILDMISLLGAMVGVPEKAAALVAQYRQQLETAHQHGLSFSKRPKVYFEEWDEPMISGIRWVSELIAIAGGDDCFAELATEHSAKQRIIADPQEVVRRAPDIVIGSWCGKKFRPDHLAARPGWNSIPAVTQQRVYEIKSCDILQPGPAALSDGMAQLCRIINDWQRDFA
ncbi:ABC transporter, substrate-binding protein (cluster 8, B12/iron complex) [Methylomonas albis]|uniref:Cobalamin-binding protein n=1 Tax=Methylomonas albis TaxID=1854563 RepID=A0ABR9D785_9GAMM|nr:cobalamin-binding protein [Methylomonas albis]MBD9358133.1 cobalamin-binding protein [Methylomonas albis]CAD6881501.1 ABC transporter, substrate-binding protein (cluster 8, B12/iron complex) [Methylomonas albis]